MLSFFPHHRLPFQAVSQFCTPSLAVPRRFLHQSRPGDWPQLICTIFTSLQNNLDQNLNSRLQISITYFNMSSLLA